MRGAVRCQVNDLRRSRTRATKKSKLGSTSPTALLKLCHVSKGDNCREAEACLLVRAFRRRGGEPSKIFAHRLIRQEGLPRGAERCDQSSRNGLQFSSHTPLPETAEVLGDESRHWDMAQFVRVWTTVAYLPRKRPGEAVMGTYRGRELWSKVGVTLTPHQVSGGRGQLSE